MGPPGGSLAAREIQMQLTAHKVFAHEAYHDKGGMEARWALGA